MTHGENYEVFITNYNQDAEKELILKLDGDSFGDVDEKSLKLDFEETKVTFNVSLNFKISEMSQKLFYSKARRAQLLRELYADRDHPQHRLQSCGQHLHNSRADSNLHSDRQIYL